MYKVSETFKYIEENKLSNLDVAKLFLEEVKRFINNPALGINELLKEKNTLIAEMCNYSLIRTNFGLGITTNGGFHEEDFNIYKQFFNEIKDKEILKEYLDIKSEQFIIPYNNEQNNYNFFNIIKEIIEKLKENDFKILPLICSKYIFNMFMENKYHFYSNKKNATKQEKESRNNMYDFALTAFDEFNKPDIQEWLDDMLNMYSPYKENLYLGIKTNILIKNHIKYLEDPKNIENTNRLKDLWLENELSNKIDFKEDMQKFYALFDNETSILKISIMRLLEGSANITLDDITKGYKEPKNDFGIKMKEILQEAQSVVKKTKIKKSVKVTEGVSKNIHKTIVIKKDIFLQSFSTYENVIILINDENMNHVGNIKCYVGDSANNYQNMSIIFEINFLDDKSDDFKENFVKNLSDEFLVNHVSINKIKEQLRDSYIKTVRIFNLEKRIEETNAEKLNHVKRKI